MDNEALKAEIRALFSDDTGSAGAGDAGGVMPDHYDNGNMNKRPEATGKPEIDNPLAEGASTRPVDPGQITTVPSVREEVGALDADGKLEENAKKQLTEAMASLKRPRENIGMDFHDDWFQRLGSTAVPYTGIGKDFPRKTGVNDVSHAKTLQYSRLVDALNNKRFISPGQAGVRSTYANNGGRSGLNDKIDYGEVYKMDGLDTAESRAQRRAEGYEKEETEREIKRTQDVKDMPAAMERLKELAVLEQAGKLSDAQRAEQQQLFASILNNQYNIPYQMMQNRFQNRLSMSARQYDTALAMQIAQYAAMNGLTTQQYAAQLGMDQARYNTMLQSVLQQFGTKLAEYMQRTIGIAMPMDKVDLVMSNPDYLRSVMQGGALGVGSPDMQTRIFADGLRQSGIDFDNLDLNTILSVMDRLQTAMARNSASTAETAANINQGS
jgi:hypothetical protein